MKKTLRRFIITICLLLPFTSVYAQQMIGYIYITEINGPLKGGFIELLGFEHQIYVPYSEDGRVSGNPVVARVKLTKYIDETTPAILNAYYSGQSFNESSITLLRMNPETRIIEPNYILLLENVRIASIINQREESTDRNIEVIELTAERFRWTSILNNIEYEIDIRSAAKIPQIYNSDIGKVYFYDESGSLIEGSEIKEKYSSRMSNFDISSYNVLDERGIPTGRTIDEAIMLQREIDQVSPRLIEHLYEIKPLRKIKLALERRNNEGFIEEYIWYEFEDVFLVSNTAQTLPLEDQLNGNFPFIETVTFIFRRMTWEHISGERGSSENPNYAEFLIGQNPNNPISVNISNYPNPFNAQTRIEFTLPSGLAGDHMKIAIYDISGRLINNLFDGIPQSQNGYVTWDGTDLNRKQVSSGSYFYMVKTGENVNTGKIVHVK